MFAVKSKDITGSIISVEAQLSNYTQLIHAELSHHKSQIENMYNKLNTMSEHNELNNRVNRLSQLIFTKILATIDKYNLLLSLANKYTKRGTHVTNRQASSRIHNP